MSHRKAKKHPRGHAKLQRLLEAAIIRSEASTITALIAEGADPGGLMPGRHRGSLHVACSVAPFRPNTAFIEALLAVKSVNVNATDVWGSTPLHILLARLGRIRTTNVIATVRLLVAAGADINARNSSGKTPLHLGVELGRWVVSALISLGAVVNLRDNEGSSALVVAARGCLSHVVTELLRAGASVNVPVPLLYHPRVLNFAPVFHKLLRAGADTKELLTHNLVTGTPLFHTKNLPVMRTLVSLGLDVNAHDYQGRTALFYACEYPELTQFLAHAGADVNVQDCVGNTALNTVLRIGLSPFRYPRIIEALYEANIDDTLTNQQGHTALDWARKIGLPMRPRVCVKLP